jgi:DNA-binding transcriptional ArsR family regulator
MSMVYKALADPTRRRVLQLLRKHEMSAGELAAEFDFAKSTMTGHFNVLRAAGLVDGRKQGNVVLYRLNATVLQEALLEFMDSFGFLESTRARARART